VAEEAKQEESKEKSVEQAPKQKSGMLTYLLLGVGGVGILAVSLFVTLMLSGGEHAEESVTDAVPVSEETSQPAGSHDSGKPETKPPGKSQPAMSAEDSILQMLEEDNSFLEEIEASLAELDVASSEADLMQDAQKLIEDSIKQINWLQQEKDRLASKEKVLNSRQKELDLLDKKISQKILRIERAESSRIASLAKLYDGMDARSVAKLMSNLDDKTVVALLPRMKAKNASQVLALLPPKRAARLSKQMITIAEK
jgi:flagellar motility protein MotE (MotC chaperone)